MVHNFSKALLTWRPNVQIPEPTRGISHSNVHALEWLEPCCTRHAGCLSSLSSLLPCSSELSCGFLNSSLFSLHVKSSSLTLALTLPHSAPLATGSWNALTSYGLHTAPRAGLFMVSSLCRPVHGLFMVVEVSGTTIILTEEGNN